jgi:hypothetical protein
MENLKTSPCRGCGKPIVWGTTPEGKKIPLDPRPPVYELVQSHPGNQRNPDPVNARRIIDAFVSHFATCPKANDFSKSNRKPGVTDAV